MVVEGFALTAGVCALALEWIVVQKITSVAVHMHT
jgi:hypothetical protein